MADQQITWSSAYRELIGRNLGLLSDEQQEHLRSRKAAVFGMGGIGGTAFHILVRCGIGRFSIVDRDVFDASNMNRQVFADRNTIGRRKIDVAADWASSVNPEAQVEKFDRVGEDNIAEILKAADIAVMGIDSLAPCVIASRECREMGLPLVEAWALPYGNVRVFTAETPTLEEAYGLPTAGRPIADISDDEFRKLGLDVLLGLGKIEGVSAFYSPQAVQRIMEGHISSFAPMVWLSGVLLALETVKVLLNWGKPAVAPHFALYDPFQHRVPGRLEE